VKIKTIFIAIIALLVFSCKEKDEFRKLASSDVLLGAPKPGEWLADHPEKGQTFEEYSKLKPMKPSKERNKIYILPMGDFTKQESKIVDLTVEYISLFYGIETIRMKTILLHKIIPDLKPEDGLVVMALTSKDLYPKPSWNFVFGLATYSDGIGITSIARYDPNNKDYAIGLRRAIKTSAHEIGHMFKMRHCTHAMCVMNGVNSLSEDDQKPNTLCSVCLKKMAWNLGLNNKERFKKLISFYEKHHLSSDAEIMKNQLKLIE
jgi:archaemetzincin